MSPSKTELRQQIKSSRLALSPTTRETLSLQIEHRLQNLTIWTEVSNLHIFEPILNLGEVDILNFVNSIQMGFPTVELFTSRKFKNTWRVETLSSNAKTKTPRFDVVIVPMLGFDFQKHRIGYGGGYYDKFLDTQPQAQKIGVCFEQGKINKIPAEPHDIAMDVIITENKIYI